MAENINEPELTAYALGEMPNAARAEFQSNFASQPEAQQEVAEIKSVAGALNRALKTEHTGPLSARRMLHVAAEVQRTSQSLRAVPGRSNWSALRKSAMAAAILFCVALLWLVWSSTPHYQNLSAANALLRRLGSALAQYQMDFHSLPPDTGFGLPPANGQLGAGKTYDAGSLWRYLGQEHRINGKSFGPYMRFHQEELVPYADPIYGKSFLVADPWGTAIGYIGDPRRVIHNPGGFDLFSAGPDRKTGQDVARSAGAPANSGINVAYDGVDNNGDGIIDNADELGPARLNGCLTVASSDTQFSREQLDDLNNWDR